MKKADPRIIRTKKLLIKSFKALSNQKLFNEITVKDITERATVNRATFYYHFNDKKALVEYIVNTDLQLYLKNPLINDTGINARTLKKIFLSAVQYHETLQAQCVNNYHYFKRLIDQKIIEVLIEQVHQLLEIEGAYKALEQRHHATTLIGWGMYGLIKKWENHQELDPEQLITEAIPSLLASLAAINK